MKKYLLAIIALSSFAGTIHANSTAGQLYYSGQISQEEYIDRLTGTRAPVYIQHSDGSSSRIHQNLNGSGYIMNSDGTSSSWFR